MTTYLVNWAAQNGPNGRHFQFYIGPENMKKLPSKVAHNWPKFFFSVLPTGPKPAQITFSVPEKCLLARLLYNDFVAVGVDGVYLVNHGHR